MGGRSGIGTRPPGVGPNNRGERVGGRGVTRRGGYADVARALNSDRRTGSGVAHSNRRTTWPWWNTSSVGIAETWNFAASCGFVSVLTLHTLKSWATAATTGFIARHGGHHGAQKSTSTGPGSSSTSRLKLYS